MVTNKVTCNFLERSGA